MYKGTSQHSAVTVSEALHCPALEPATRGSRAMSRTQGDVPMPLGGLKNTASGTFSVCVAAAATAASVLGLRQ